MSALMYVLLRVPGQEGQVQQNRYPVPVDQEQDSKECVYSGLGDDVRVEPVAEIDWVDVVTTDEFISACCWYCMLHKEAVASVLGRPHSGSGRAARKEGMQSLPFQIAIHDREEDLEEEVDRIYQHGQQIQPCFSRHHRKGRRKPSDVVRF